MYLTATCYSIYMYNPTAKGDTWTSETNTMVQQRCEQQANRRSSHDRQPTTHPFSPTSTTMINNRNLKIVLPEEVQVISEMETVEWWQQKETVARGRSLSCSCVCVIHCQFSLRWYYRIPWFVMCSWPRTFIVFCRTMYSTACTPCSLSDAMHSAWSRVPSMHCSLLLWVNPLMGSIPSVTGLLTKLITYYCDWNNDVHIWILIILLVNRIIRIKIWTSLHQSR
jgi:hypothetical protein